MTNRYGLADPCCGVRCSYCQPETFHAEMKVVFTGVKDKAGGSPDCDCQQWNRPEGYIVVSCGEEGGPCTWFGPGPSGCATVRVEASATCVDDTPGTPGMRCWQWWVISTSDPGSGCSFVICDDREVLRSCEDCDIGGGCDNAPQASPEDQCDWTEASYELEMVVP